MSDYSLAEIKAGTYKAGQDEWLIGEVEAWRAAAKGWQENFIEAQAEIKRLVKLYGPDRNPLAFHNGERHERERAAKIARDFRLIEQHPMGAAMTAGWNDASARIAVAVLAADYHSPNT